jgi:hypothetical protein
MELKEPIATFVRVARPDTLMIRLMVPQIQSMVTTRLLLEGVECTPEAVDEIDTWCDLHGNGDQFRLVTPDYFRDSYGRMLGDLQDLDTGEMLTDHLIDTGVATARPNHYLDLLREMLASGGPEA